MGYDMYVVDESGENVRDCSDHEQHYWRRNMSGGGRQAEKLVEAGMGEWSPDNVWRVAEEAGFPKRPPGVEWVDRGDDDSGYEGDGAEEFQAALDAHLRDPRGVTRGIPVYKLCNTNDGWWVTKQECADALMLWEANGRPDVDTFNPDVGPYGDTIPFLRAAADHGGFRVY